MAKRTYTVVLEVDDRHDDDRPLDDMSRLCDIAIWLEVCLTKPSMHVNATVYAGNCVRGECL